MIDAAAPKPNRPKTCRKRQISKTDALTSNAKLPSSDNPG